MAYTWEEVILGIDLKHEMDEKERKQEEIEAAATKESGLQAAWSLGLSVLGASIFGPAGYFMGKQFGKWGADAGILPWPKDASQWESMEMDEGKFFAEDAKKFNKELKKRAKDVNQSQLLDSVIDLGTMWIQAGGLKEGFDPSIGGGDWTTFGTGDDAWTVFGEGTLVDKIPGAKTLPGDQSIFAGGGTPIWQKGGLKQFSENLKGGAKRVGQAYGQEQQVKGVAACEKKIDTLYEEYVKGT